MMSNTSSIVSARSVTAASVSPTEESAPVPVVEDVVVVKKPAATNAASLIPVLSARKSISPRIEEKPAVSDKLPLFEAPTKPDTEPPSATAVNLDAVVSSSVVDLSLHSPPIRDSVASPTKAEIAMDVGDAIPSTSLASLAMTSRPESPPKAVTYTATAPVPITPSAPVSPAAAPKLAAEVPSPVPPKLKPEPPPMPPPTKAKKKKSGCEIM